MAKEEYHYLWNEHTFELTQNVKINGKYCEVGVMYGITPKDLEKLHFLCETEISFSKIKEINNDIK